MPVLPWPHLVSESALEAPPVAHRDAAGNTLAGTPATVARGLKGRLTWWAVALALVVVSIALLAWARTAPSYDAFGWLVWGYQTVHGHLDLGGAPSWKPIPYVFTLPYALLGMTAEKWLWEVTAVAVSLGGAIVAGRIAFRVTLTGSAHRDPHAGDSASEAPVRMRTEAAWAAAVVAGLALLGTEDYMHYILSVQSDPMLVTFTLAAIDSYLCGRRRLAIVFGILAALGRPEAWPFLGLYGLYCWRRVPRSRLLLLAGAAFIAFMWFGIPWITNGRPFVSAQLALESPRELKQDQIMGTLGRFHELLYLPIWIAAGLAVVWGAWRRDRLVLSLAGIVVGWVVVEIAFALHGWPALPRYMFEAGGIVAVLAGVAVGWVLTELPGLRRGIPRWAGIPLVVVLAATLLPGAISRLRAEHRDLRHERGRATDIRLLPNAIASLGGWQHIWQCAKPTANVEWVSALAFYVHSDVGVLGHLPVKEIHWGHAIAWFVPVSSGGWHIQTFNLHPRNYAVCSQLSSFYVVAPGHPNGQLKRS